MIGFTRSGGYLHRDVSIGNVIRLDKPAQRPAFNIRERMAGLVHPPDIVEGMKNLRVDSQDSDGDGFWKDLIVATTEESLKAVVRAAERLEKALAQVGLSTECLAVLIDSDMAAPLEGYFSSSEHSGVISGTPEFMSERLIAALREVELTYVQNPVDDLKSFMWTTVWGAVFNPRADGSQMQNRLVHWRRMLRTHERLSALSAIEGSVLDDSSPIVKGISSLIRMWRRELEDLEVKFGYAFKKALNADQKLHVFYQSALEGVALYAELLHELRETLGLKLEVTQ
ncbi:hypothetical protein C8Q80DRAFT_373079 [Daedaleopsis nitida]|nr:hypothetical protein C8Q80DRAFT_373079 [Daedaleopsis nitida]